MRTNIYLASQSARKADTDTRQFYTSSAITPTPHERSKPTERCGHSKRAKMGDPLCLTVHSIGIHSQIDAPNHARIFTDTRRATATRSANVTVTHRPHRPPNSHCFRAPPRYHRCRSQRRTPAVRVPCRRNRHKRYSALGEINIVYCQRHYIINKQPKPTSTSVMLAVPLLCATIETAAVSAPVPLTSRQFLSGFRPVASEVRLGKVRKDAEV